MSIADNSNEICGYRKYRQLIVDFDNSNFRYNWYCCDYALVIDIWNCGYQQCTYITDMDNSNCRYQSYLNAIKPIADIDK